MPDKNIALNFNAVDEMQEGILLFHSRCQEAFDGTLDVLNSIIGIYHEIPEKAKDPALLSTVESARSTLKNQNCMEDGLEINDKIQGLSEGLFEIEQLFAKSLRDIDIWQKVSELRIQSLSDIYGIQADSYPDLAPEKVMEFEALVYDYVIREIEKEGNSTNTQYKMSRADAMEYTRVMMERLYYHNPQFIKTYLESGASDTKEFGMQEMLADSWDTCKQAVAIGRQLSNMSFTMEDGEHKWNTDFCKLENCYMLIETCKDFEIDTPKERAFFLGQIFTETNGGDSYIETLGLLDGKKNPLNNEFNEELAEYYVRNAKNSKGEPLYGDFENPDGQYYKNNYISEEVMRELGFGDIEADIFNAYDIVRYRGGGAIHLTHKDAYYRFASYVNKKYYDKDACQDIIGNGAYSTWLGKDGEYRFTSAGWSYAIFKGIKLENYDTTNLYLENGEVNTERVDEIVLDISIKINGGYNGLEKRQKATCALLGVLEGE